MLFDTHCHLDADEYNSITAVIWEEANKAGVDGCIIPALNGSIRYHKELLTLKGVHGSFGYHPANANESIVDKILQLDFKTIGYKPIAIGECGLDRNLKVPLKTQIEVFEAQLKLAKKNKLPVLVHLLGHWKEALSLLRNHKTPIILHSFNGSKEIAKQFLSIGCYFSFSASLQNKGYFKAKESVTIIPNNRIFIESDSPSMKPDIFEDTYNKPSSLPIILKAMAKLRNNSEDDLCIVLRENLNAVFPQI